MNVAGIDYSTHAIDIVLVPYEDEGTPRWARLDLQGNDAFDRTRDVANAMFPRGSSWWDSVVAVGIEHPGGHHGTRDMLRVQGAILACLPARMLVEPWPPAKWRKAVGLPGNASKGLVRQESIAIHLRRILVRQPSGRHYYADSQMQTFDDWPQDAHDAHLIALATRQAISEHREAAA